MKSNKYIPLFVVTFFAAITTFFVFFCDGIYYYKELQHTTSVKKTDIKFNLFVDINKTKSSVFSEVNDLSINALNCSMKDLMRLDSFASLINWNYDLDHAHLTLSIGNCNFDVIDRDFARECIRRNSPDGIRLMGDSMTRYQYLNLAHFLATGNWTSDKAMPNENERKFPGWTDFYQLTNQRMQGYEICDCQRANEIIIEHRYFNHDNIMISYNQIFGRESDVLINDLQLLNISSCKQSKCQQDLCSPGACGSTPSLKNLGTILNPGVLQEMFELLPSSDTFFNAGHWWMSSEQANTFPLSRDHFVNEIFNARQAGMSSRFHWKMTTGRASMNIQPEYAFANELVSAAVVCDIFDSFSITAQIPLNFPEMQWDSMHFESDIYVGLNQALISFICS